MMPTLLIQGNFDQASQLLQQLLVADLPLDCVIMPNTTDDTPRYQPLVVASALCPRLTIRVGTTADYGQATWLVVLDRDSANTPVNERVADLRLLMNRIVENGFGGQLIFCGHQDEILTYFAWKFSGFPRQQIWGLGTYPLARLITARLAERLHVGHSAVQATVVGAASAPIVAWSRTYVGPTPLLMYLANADAKFNADDLSKMGTWLAREAGEQQVTLRFLALIHLLQAAMDNQPVIASVTHVYPEELGFAAAAPVLVAKTGVKDLMPLALSEDEQQDYAAQTAELRTTIQAIENQQTEGK